MEQRILTEIERWKQCATRDENLLNELAAMDEEALTEAFYTDLSFGTAGLRGVLGVGTNRMNVYTVGAASQGLAAYVKNHYPEGKRVIALSRDSRINSELFTRTSAAIFAANGIKTYVYSELMPTPCLSFAVRYLGASAGVMITASHNPAKYNGYKVYGEDGAQMTEEGANEVLSEIRKLDLFKDVLWGDYEAALKDGSIEIMGEEVYTAFTEEVKKQSVLPKDFPVRKDAEMIYTPLHGAGLKPVLRVLKEWGYTNITVVKEQEQPDGNFPTCPYPNPEIRETMALGMDLARKNEADLLIATDPDSDRVSIAVRTPEGEYEILSGNELGCLLLNYVASMRKAGGTMPEKPVAVKSVVSTDLATKIAEKYGVEMRNVLTGFKYIGDQIALLEKTGEEKRYIFGFEESCGYLSGTYCRDKDAVDAAFLVAEMFSYYAAKGLNLYGIMQDIYREFGFYQSVVHSFAYEGIAGQARMKEIMAEFRKGLAEIGTYRVEKLVDYNEGVDGLPAANVLKFYLSDEASVVVRPSGTEPKIKVYVTVKGVDKADAAEKEAALFAAVSPLLS